MPLPYMYVCHVSHQVSMLLLHVCHIATRLWNVIASQHLVDANSWYNVFTNIPLCRKTVLPQLLVSLLQILHRNTPTIVDIAVLCVQF